MIAEATSSQVANWGTLAAIFVLAFLNEFGRRRAASLLLKADAVKTKKLDEIHVLVNSAMGKALRANMLSSRRVAELTKTPADIAVADQAEHDYKDHMAKQGAIDSGNTGPAASN